MAVLAFAALGASIGAGFAGFLGLSGAAIGWAAGSFIGNALFNKPPDQQGPRITDTKADAGAYGQGINNLWGRGSVTGETIYLSPLKETRHTQSVGKGGGGSYTTFTYAADMLVRFCVTPKAGKTPHIRRMWANGTLIYDSATLKKVDEKYLKLPDLALYTGDFTEGVDPMYSAAVGAANAPAHYGYMKASFTNFQLAEFGNRPPIIKAEIYTDSVGGAGGMNVVQVDMPPASVGFGEWAVLDTVTGELIVEADLPTTGQAIYRVDTATGAINSSFSGVPSSTVGLYSSGGYLNFTTRNVGYDPVNRIIYAGDINTKIASFDVASSSFIATSTLPFAATPFVNETNGDLWTGVTYYTFYAQSINLINTITGTVFSSIPLASNASYLSPPLFESAILAYFTTDDYDLVGGGTGSGVRTLYSLDLTSGTRTAMMAIGGSLFPVALVGTKIWLMDGAGNFAIYDTTVPSTLNAFVLPDTATASFIEAVPSAVNGALYYLVHESGGGKKLVAYDVASDTKIGEYVLNPSDSLTWAETSTSTAYFGLNSNSFLKVTISSGSATPVKYSLAEIITDVSEMAGLSAGDIDVTESASVMVDGYASTGITTGRGMLEQLLMVYGFDAVRSGYQVAFRNRVRTPVATLTDKDFLVMTGNRMEGPGALEMPRTCVLSYADGESGEYGVASVPATLQTVDATGTIQVQTAAVLSASQAGALAWRLLVTAWTERQSFRRALPIKWAKLEPGDVVTLPVGTQQINARIQKIVDAGVRRELDLIGIETNAYSQALVGPGRILSLPLTLGGVLSAYPVLMDIPPLRTKDAGLVLYVAVVVNPGGAWRGGMLQKSYDGGTTWADVMLLTEQAPHGTLTSSVGALNHAQAGVDRSIHPGVDMLDGSLYSVTGAQMRAGANLAWANGELIQFEGATLTGPGSYALSGIARNRIDDSIGLSNPSAGDDFIMLTQGGVVAAPMQRTDIGKNIQFRIATDQQALDEIVPNAISYLGRSMMPRAPSFTKFSRDGSGNFTATWVRRNLRDLGWYDGKDMPLEESPEKYRLRIWDATRTTVKRDIEVTAVQTATYSAINQIIDFGSVQSVLEIDLQMYSEYFAGYANSELYSTTT